MNLFKVIAIAIITLFLTLIVKEFKPEISMYISIAGGILILFSIIDDLFTTVTEFRNILKTLKIDNKIFKILFKIIIVGYLTEFSASLCKDANNNLLADKIILAGKIMIFSISLPIFKNIIQIIVDLI